MRVSRDFQAALPGLAFLTVPTIGFGPRSFDFTPKKQGLGNLGTLNGGVTTTPGGFGVLGASWATNGTDGNVNCGTPSGINGASAATLCAVFSRTSTSIQVGAGGANGPSSGASGNRFSLIWFTDGNLYFNTENSTICSGFCALSGTGTHFVSLQFNGAGATNADKVKIKVDGQPQTLSFGTSPPSTLGTVCPISIGKDSSDRFCGGSYLFLGAWSVCLTDQQITALYDCLLTGEPFPLFEPQTAAMMMGSAVAPAGGGLLLRRRRAAA